MESQKINISFSISHLTLRHKGRRNSTRPWTQQGKERNQSHKLLSLLPNVACMMEIPAQKKNNPEQKKICSIFSSLILDAGGVRKSFFPFRGVEPPTTAFSLQCPFCSLCCCHPSPLDLPNDAPPEREAISPSIPSAAADVQSHRNKNRLCSMTCGIDNNYINRIKKTL